MGPDFATPGLIPLQLLAQVNTVSDPCDPGSIFPWSQPRLNEAIAHIFKAGCFRQVVSAVVVWYLYPSLRLATHRHRSRYRNQDGGRAEPVRRGKCLLGCWSLVVDSAALPVRYLPLTWNMRQRPLKWSFPRIPSFYGCVVASGKITMGSWPQILCH